MTTAVRNWQQIEERKVLAKVLRAVIKRRLTAPVLFTLESFKPFSFIASQVLIVFGPLVRTFLSVADYDVFISAIQNRDNIAWMIEQLEIIEERQTFFGDSAANSPSDESQ